MKLTASVIVRDELDRYLVPFLQHLAGFVDEIRVLDDGSTDDWADRLRAADGTHALDLDVLHVLRAEETSFWQDEGAARQALLEWTLEGQPDWVLAIDADEFVSDGAALRALIDAPAAPAVYTLNMREIWVASDECLCVRQDGGWREHGVPILWRVPGPTVRQLDRAKPYALRQWRIPERKVAPGREPVAVRTLARNGRHVAASGVDVLHFGWACRADRQARYQRYLEHDGGRYHASAHLASIMFPDSRVKLEGIDWPPLEPDVAAAVLSRARAGDEP